MVDHVRKGLREPLEIRERSREALHRGRIREGGQGCRRVAPGAQALDHVLQLRRGPQAIRDDAIAGRRGQRSDVLDALDRAQGLAEAHELGEPGRPAEVLAFTRLDEHAHRQELPTVEMGGHPVEAAPRLRLDGQLLDGVELDREARQGQEGHGEQRARRWSRRVRGGA